VERRRRKKFGGLQIFCSSLYFVQAMKKVATMLVEGEVDEELLENE
jgi:hypothetical protein